MTTVTELLPGDKVTSPTGEGNTFVARCPHPLYGGLSLVIWRLADRSWSHDALSPLQDVGDVKPATHGGRVIALRAALFGEADDS